MSNQSLSGMRAGEIAHNLLRLWMEVLEPFHPTKTEAELLALLNAEYQTTPPSVELLTPLHAALDWLVRNDYVQKIPGVGFQRTTKVQKHAVSLGEPYFDVDK